MVFRVRRVDYFYSTVNNHEGEAWGLLSKLAEMGVDLLAFSAVPLGPSAAQLTLFPADDEKLQRAAQKTGLTLEGPHPALLAQGDDELGALADVHAKLFDAGVRVYASNGVTDGRGSYGYLLYVRPEDYAAAARSLGV